MKIPLEISARLFVDDTQQDSPIVIAIQHAGEDLVSFTLQDLIQDPDSLVETVSEKACLARALRAQASEIERELRYA